MSLSTSLRITPITDNCRVDFSYLYVWNEPYDVVDATYLVFGKNKETSLKSLESFIYKLWYINPGCSYLDMTNHLIGILNKKSSKGVFITETDISDLVFRIMNTRLPSDISDLVLSKFTSKGIIKTKRVIEWKSNINGLLVINNDRMSEIRKSSDINKELSNEYRKIKIKYMKKCIDNVKSDDNQVLIESAIDVLRENNDEANINQVSKVCGLSYTTTKKYIDLMAERLNFIDGFKVVINKNNKIADETIKTLLSAKEKLISDGKKLNKSNINKYSNISRPTINKYWSIINK